MTQFGKELRMYADNGLRSAAAWQVLGRQIATGSKPCASVLSHGAAIELFSKDQTEMRPRRQAHDQKSAD